MFTLYHSFVGEAKGQNATRKLQMLVIHPSEYYDYANYFKLDYCLPPLLQDLLKSISFDIPVFFQQQNALIDFKPFAATKETNFCMSFNALCRLLHLFDSPTWEKRKEHALMKASEDLNQPSFQTLCPYFRRLVPSQRNSGSFSCTEMIDNPSSTVTLMFRIEANIEKGSNQHTMTAWLQYFKTPDGAEVGGEQEPISFAYDVSLFRLEELVLNLKPHLLKERDIAERANASLDLVTQAMQENDVFGVQFAESPPTLQPQQLFSNLHPSQYLFGITAPAAASAAQPSASTTTAAATATTTSVTSKSTSHEPKKRHYTSKTASSHSKHTKK